MTDPDYDQSYAGVGELLRSPEMQAAMLKLARKVLSRARAIAPVDTGAYKAGLVASAGVEDGRAYGRVTATVPYSPEVEYGVKGKPGHRTLGKALDAVNGA